MFVYVCVIRERRKGAGEERKGKKRMNGSRETNKLQKETERQMSKDMRGEKNNAREREKEKQKKG